jgi:hypothetical protein
MSSGTGHFKHAGIIDIFPEECHRVIAAIGEV